MKRHAFAFLLAIISTLTVDVEAQQAEVQQSLGQRNMKQLSSMVGEWEVTEKDGTTSTMTIRWINNKSFIELVNGNYREITRWDLVENRFVTQAFGEVGGHAKYVWTQKASGAWALVAEPAYYVASGEAVPWQATIRQIDHDTIEFKGTFNGHVMENTARRKKPKSSD